MATRKTQQLDIDLSTVQDPTVREVLVSVLRFVNELAAGGLRTQGDVVGKTLQVGSGLAEVDAAGDIVAKSINLHGGGKVKMDVREGSVAASGSVTLTVKGQVLGCIGKFKQGSTGNWIVIQTNTTVFWQADSSGDVRVRIFNADSATCKYRVIIFWRE